MLNIITKWVTKLIICIGIGTGLILLVYILPVEPMKENVARSSEIFNYEGTYPQLVSGYKYTQLDNFTDSLMLGTAIYNGEESIVDKAMNNYNIGGSDNKELSQVLAVSNYANNVPLNYYFNSYGRYWHGYVVPLKTLLLFFDYADIRIFNLLLQGILLLRIIYLLLVSCNMKKYFVAFIAAIFVINPITATLSLQFSWVYFIILISSVYLLEIYNRNKITELKIENLFFIVGVLTSFFDLLTYPLATFGILFILYMNLDIDSDTATLSYLKQTGKKLMLWLTGYAGMWLGKWIIGSILLKQNLFADALNQMLFRASSECTGWEQFTRFKVLIVNAKVFMKWPFVILALFGIILYALSLKRKRFNPNISIVRVIVYLVVAIMPIVWLFVLANHSRIHYWFTYKELSIFFFSIISLGIYLRKDESELVSDTSG